MAVAGFEKGIKEIEVLQKALGISDYLEFCRVINDLVEEGKLKPTKGGKDTNGKNPPLAKKYRIIEDKEEYDKSSLEKEINRYFPLSYSRTYYKNHPSQYLKDRDMILKLCSYHKRQDKPLEGIMSYNERLFDLFKQEKIISNGNLSTVLDRLGLDEGYLNFYKTPEPFIYYSRNENEKQTILIIENKDTWYTMRKLIMAGYGPFDTIIYGEGKKIISSIEELQVHQKKHFRNSGNEFKYFGDLDDEGLGIFLSLVDKIPEIRLKLWTEGYKKMVDLACCNDGWRVYKNQRNLERDKLKEVLPFMDDAIIDLIFQRFSNNEYIPQEIVNYQILKKMWTRKRG